MSCTGLNMLDPSTPSTPGAGPDAQSVITALLRPLARLAVSGGVSAAVLEEQLKLAIVQEAQQALLAADLPAHRLVSRISASTGLSRREVSRLTQEDDAPQATARHWPSEVFTRWVTHRQLRGPDGRAMPLPRQGEMPSFDGLARSVTQNIHPRSLLEALCQLGVARWDEASDTVHLLTDTFVPQGDKATMLGFLQDNVGDHLAGAVHNVFGDGLRPHQDQSVFADELSQASLDRIRVFIDAQWQTMLQAAVPLLEQCIEDDRQAGRTQDQRVRMGLYSFEAPMNEAAPIQTSGRDTPHEQAPSRRKR
jgi:hypothetical protein